MERATTLIRRLGRLVHDWREEAGLTQGQLAARAGMSKKHVGDIERGDVEASLSALDCLARAFDMSLPELLAWITTSPRRARPTLPLRDWLRVQESLDALKDYADRMVSQRRTSGSDLAAPPATYRRRRVQRRPAKRRRR